MDNIAYYTQEGLNELKAELERLEKIERPRISKEIAEARDKGDLSENAEYDAAKEAQGLLEAKIAKLQNLLLNARLIDESKKDTSKVYILNSVKIRDIQNDRVLTYQLVPEREANVREGKISIASPIGKGLIGKKVGDKVEIKVPAGIIHYEIIEIF